MKTITVICILLFYGTVSAQENISPKIIEEKKEKLRTIAWTGALLQKMISDVLP